MWQKLPRVSACARRTDDATVGCRGKCGFGRRAQGSHNRYSVPNPPLVRRVEILEEKVDALSQLPERVTGVEMQLVAVRDDLHSLRGEVTTLRDELRSFREEFTSRDEFTSFRNEVLREFAAVSVEIHAGDEETRRQMRVLHEDVISRIALLQEGIDRRNGRSGRSARTPPKRRR